MRPPPVVLIADPVTGQANVSLLAICAVGPIVGVDLILGRRSDDKYILFFISYET